MISDLKRAAVTAVFRGLLQQDINDKMRAILVDWLVEVHLKFKVRRHHQPWTMHCHPCTPGDPNVSPLSTPSENPTALPYVAVPHSFQSQGIPYQKLMTHGDGVSGDVASALCTSDSNAVMGKCWTVILLLGALVVGRGLTGNCGRVVQLMPETLFLTTNLIDRFLEIKGVTRKNLQLVRIRAQRQALHTSDSASRTAARWATRHQ